MAELQAYEEVGPVKRDPMHVYDDIKNDNKMNNVSSPSWKQYIKMFIIVISVSLMCAVVSYFTVNAQIQQKLNLIDTRLAEIEKKNEETENRHNLTFVHLQKQISESTELVAITAHPSSSTRLSGIIKFDDVTFSVGVNNLTTYKNTGKFVVEKEGLYLISIAISSNNNRAQYHINLNGNVISYARVTGIRTFLVHYSDTVNVVVALQLRLNDILITFI